jgi:hypothetical protein
MFKEGDRFREKATGKKGTIEHIEPGFRDREIGGELVEEKYILNIEVKFDDGTFKDCSEDDIESA